MAGKVAELRELTALWREELAAAKAVVLLRSPAIIHH